jgi:hypothetical protein
VLADRAADQPNISLQDITALKALKNPPDVIKRIFDCVLLLRWACPVMPLAEWSQLHLVMHCGSLALVELQAGSWCHSLFVLSLLVCLSYAVCGGHQPAARCLASYLSSTGTCP